MLDFAGLLMNTVADCVFQKWPHQYIPSCLFLTFYLSGRVPVPSRCTCITFVAALTKECGSNAIWLSRLGHRSHHAFCVALSWDTCCWDPATMLWGSQFQMDGLADCPIKALSWQPSITECEWEGFVFRLRPKHHRTEGNSPCCTPVWISDPKKIMKDDVLSH